MQEQLRHLGSTEQVPIDEPVIGVSPKDTPLLELRSVCKRYGSFAALDNVNFFIGKSEVVGLLGDNGAGKSTLVRMMSGINRPTSGGNLCGREIGDSQHPYGIGSCWNRNDLSGHRSCRFHVNHTKHLYGPGTH